MFRKLVPSMSYPAFLDMVVTERVLSIASYVEITKDVYERDPQPSASQSEPIRSLRFTADISPGELPPTVEGVYYNRLPCVRLDKPLVTGDLLDASLAGRYFKAHSYSLLDLDDPSIRSGEKSDAAVWVCGIDYDGHLHPFYNSIAHETATKMHPMRSVRLIGAPSVLFVYQPFADVPLTECSMTLKHNVALGFRSNVSGWTAPVNLQDYSYLGDMDEALPKLALLSGGGDIGVDQKQVVSVELRDAAGQKIARDAVIYLESTAGYLPKQRVNLAAGDGSFPVMATGLSPGDSFKVKVGFRNFSGVLDVPFTVV
jgi:hypothetical protein